VHQVGNQYSQFMMHGQKNIKYTYMFSLTLIIYRNLMPLHVCYKVWCMLNHLQVCF